MSHLTRLPTPRVVVIRYDAVLEGLRQLAERLGVSLLLSHSGETRSPGATTAELPGAQETHLSRWSPWIYDDSATALHPVLAALDRDGCAPPMRSGVT